MTRFENEVADFLALLPDPSAVCMLQHDQIRNMFTDKKAKATQTGITRQAQQRGVEQWMNKWHAARNRRRRITA